MSKRKTAQAAIDQTAAVDAVQPTTDQPVESTSPATPAGAESQPDQREKQRNPVRSWGERYDSGVRYQVLTDSRLGKSGKIIIKFKLPEGQYAPSPEVLAIMRAAKVNADGSPSGLEFRDLHAHGKAWTIPNDPEGRDLMFAIQSRLEKLGVEPAAAPEQTR